MRHGLSLKPRAVLGDINTEIPNDWLLAEQGKGWATLGATFVTPHEFAIIFKLEKN